MASGYRSGGVDFDDLFDPDVTGDGPAVPAPGMRSGGVPLRYAKLAYGTKRSDVGYRHAGVDVSNLWAAKGTAVYVSDGGLPSNLADYRQAPPGGELTASVSFEYRSMGVVAWFSGGWQSQGRWLGGGSSAGNYEIRFDVISGAGFTGPVGQWLRLDANRGGGVSVTSPTTGMGTISRSTTVRVTMRKRSDNSVVFAKDVQMAVTVDRDSSM